MEEVKIYSKPWKADSTVRIIKIEGFLDTTTSQNLAKTLDSLLEREICKMVIDLEADYISSPGWGILVGDIRRIRESLGDLKLARMKPEVYEIYALLGLDSFIESYDSVEEALQAYSPLRTSKPEITVTVDDDRVTLSGYVPSISIRDMAAILTGTVTGVDEVVNDLIAAPDLERSVAMALAADDRTRSWPIRVRAELGYVQLQGQVPDQETAQAALDVAYEVTGPKQIVSAIKVPQSA